MVPDYLNFAPCAILLLQNQYFLYVNVKMCSIFSRHVLLYKSLPSFICMFACATFIKQYHDYLAAGPKIVIAVPLSIKRHNKDL